jgi:hypothetical protein
MEAKRYSVSRDGETYHGSFATLEEAKAEGSRWVGEIEYPMQPEFWWSAEDWLEHVSCQEEYSHEAAEGWDTSTEAERQELEKEVHAVMAAWLDRHKLRPEFFCVENVIDLTDSRTPATGDERKDG